MPTTIARPAPAPEGSALRQRLAVLRRRLWRVAIVRGVSWLVVYNVAVAVLAGLVDWSCTALGFPLPGLLRAVVLVGWLAGDVGLVWYFLVRPLSARTDDLTLALRVEKQFPALNDALASAVQFLEDPEGKGGDSANLRREAVRRGLGKAERLDFNRVVNTRGLRTTALAAAGACLVALLLVVFFPGAAGASLMRLLNPFGAREAPTLTQLVIDQPPERVSRNEPFVISGKVRGAVPAQGVVTLRLDGAQPVEIAFDVRQEKDHTGTIDCVLKASRVPRSFHFQVRAGDAVSKEYDVKVLPPPQLAYLNKQPSPQLQVFPPRYTGLPSPQPLPPGVGAIDAPVGTFVVLRAAADHALREAWIEYRPTPDVKPPDPNPVLATAMLGPLGAPHIVGAASLAVCGETVWGHVPAVLDDDRTTFTVRFLPRVANGIYELHFVDDDGLRGSRLFELRLREDPAPTVQLDRPSKTRDVLSVLPTAVLPLQATAEDPLYGLRSAYLEYRFQPDGPASQAFLHDPGTAAERLIAPWAGPAVLAAPPDLRPTRMEFRRALPVASLRHPDGSSPREGDTVYLQACADDWDDVSVNKQPGRSVVVEIRIIDRNELELTLNQEQAEVQQKLLRLREKEREALQKSADAERKLKKIEKTVPDEADQSEEAKKKRAEVDLLRKDVEDEVRQAQQLQKEIQEGVGTRKEGLRAQAARVLDTLDQNNLSDPAARDRMERVEKELDRLAKNELPQIDPPLTAALKEAELLDEQNRAQRQTLLEEQARDLDRQAAEAEKAAQSRANAAAEDERHADATPDAAEKARLKADAGRRHKEAEELRDKAEAMRKEAARERGDAAEKPDPAAPQKSLAQARKRQEEVEKTLNDLLTRMEPWSNSREVKGEASRLLQEERKLQADVEKLQNEEQQNKLLGKEPKELTEAQRAELDNLRDSQKRLQERTEALLNKMKRIAEERAAKDPETAKEMKDAYDKGVQGDVGGKMQNAEDKLGKNQLGDAAEDQKKAAAELQKMVKGFEERHEADLDELAKKLRKKEKELEELAKEQDELRKKIEEAGKIGDAAEREKQLEKLGLEQKNLEKKAKDIVEQLSKMGADRASRAMAQADGAMNQAGNQLNQGKKPEEDDALDRLDEARKEVEKARKEAEEELSREQQARVADAVQGLKDRQESLNQEAARLKAALAENKDKGSLRKLLLSVRNLADSQKGLGDETAGLGRKELAGTPVFLRLMLRSGEAMTDASAKLEEGGKAETAAVDDEVARLQKDATHRLALVIDALKSDNAGLQPPGGKQGGGSGDGGGDGGGGGGQADQVPPTAQLKVLRAMQQEVKEHTEAFVKDHADLTKLNDKEKAELQSIRKEQQDVADLLEEFRHPPEPGEGEPEKDKDKK